MKRTYSKQTQKQTHTLKSLLEREQVRNLEFEPIVTIEEDLLESNNSQETQITATNQSSLDGGLVNSTELFHRLINKEITKAATQLELDQAELQAWIDLQIEVPPKIILGLLRTMRYYQLDPLIEEIGLTKYEDANWGVYITVEGCSKLLNRNDQFNGLVFNQSDQLIEGIPEWIECSIYRRDPMMPITVREYLLEVKNDQSIWQKMPRRMLRHLALQQCVRLAIG